MNKNHLFLKILAATIGSFVLSFVFAAVGGVHKDYPTSIGEKYSEKIENAQQVNLEKEIEIQSIKEVRIKSAWIDWEVNPAAANAPSGKAQLQISGRFDLKGASPESLVTTRIEGDVLYIETNEHETSRKSFSWKIQDSDSKARLQLPTGLSRVRIQNVSGDIDVGTFALEELSLTTVSGDLEIEVTSVRKLGITTISGDIEIEGSIDDIQLESISGDLDWKASNAKVSGRIETTSGDVKMKFSQMPNTAFNFSSVSGKMKGGSASGDGHLTVETISGDLTVTR